MGLALLTLDSKLFDNDDNPRIWNDEYSEWVTRSECLIEGPTFISCKVVLNYTYDAHDVLLKSFFTSTLGIYSCTIDDALLELDHRREGSESDMSLAITTSIYEYINANARGEDDWERIKYVAMPAAPHFERRNLCNVAVLTSDRKQFSEKKMIFGDDHQWYTLSSCLWSSTFALVGFQDLTAIYNSLEPFFVRRLGVKKASLSMHIKEVKRMAGELQPQIGQITSRLVEIGMMLAARPVDDSIARALASLQEVKFLPMRMVDNTVVLVAAVDRYAIPDHERYRDAFSGHGVLLDFDVEEVQLLHPIFKHLRLTKRYLSNLVKEVSTVGDDTRVDNKLSRQLVAKAYALYW